MSDDTMVNLMILSFYFCVFMVVLVVGGSICDYIERRFRDR